MLPADGREDYVAITQFDTQHNLDDWLESAERANWLTKLGAIDIYREDVVIMASSRRTIAGADWSRRQNEAKVQCALSIVTSSHRSSAMPP